MTDVHPGEPALGVTEIVPGRVGHGVARRGDERHRGVPTFRDIRTGL